MLPTAEIQPVDLKKVRLKLSGYSRHGGQRIYATGGRLFFGIYKKADFPETAEDKYHTVVQGEELRLDLLSYAYYRTPELWYVIAIVNDLVSVFDDVKIGDVLRIPSLSTIYSAL